MMTTGLDVRHAVDGTRHTLTLHGELDMGTAPVLADAVVEACNRSAEELLLDISGLAFIDSTGLRALLASRTCSEEHGCSFLLSQGTPQVERLFQLAGVVEHFAGCRVTVGQGSGGGQGPMAAASADTL